MLLTAAAGMAFVGAIVVFLFGVIETTGVYGSRLAWLLGIVLPLLFLGALFARLAARIDDSTVDGDARGQVVSSQRLRTFSVIGWGLVAVPFALAAMLLFTYGVFFAIHGVRIAAHWVIH
ncbi:MAG TPA: hypothetical protein VND67_08630 [Acidimicrobiales bacterium]|nr:hypothetical protein [Acidimicrobiales bacterium]